MGFNSVYRSLVEMFPQIDVRVLKAVAIEHSKDADSAADYILMEVLPRLSQQSVSSPRQTPSSGSPKYRSLRVPRDVDEAENEEDNALMRRRSTFVRRRFRNMASLIEQGSLPNSNETDKNLTHAHVSDSTSKNDEGNALMRHRRTFFRGRFRNMGSSIEQGSLPNSSETNKDLTHAQVSDSTSQNNELDTSTVLLSYHDDNGDKQLAENSESEELILLGVTQPKVDEVYSNALMNGDGKEVDLNQVCDSAESDESASVCEDEEINVKIGSDQTTFVSSTTLIQENGSSLDKALLEESCQVISSYGGIENATVETAPSSVKELVPDVLQCVLCPEVGTGPSTTECEKQDDSGSSDLKSEKVSAMSEECDIVDELCTNTIVTRSDQICKIDLLEEMVEDAKNNKKTLFSAMESIMSMMKEVELQEKAAEQAKAEAAKGGVDIMVKVEELKDVLVHAKEANDMHAGEIYGEKAILATEGRELQTRLLNLSEERDASLAILNEMRESLEARLAAAEEVRKVAEQEKLMKEESARKYLAEQEAIMEKVVQESKILQKEAEENSKLQEFLMDRGHLVDSLQGEISVICQDVRLLKQKFDERVPLSQSISSSQTTCRLASSGSSVKSMASLAAEQGLTSETPERMSSAHMTDIQTPEIKLQNETNRRELLDDGWDLFDNDA